MQSDIYKKMLEVTHLFFAALDNDAVLNSNLRRSGNNIATNLTSGVLGYDIATKCGLIVAYVDDWEDFCTAFVLESDYNAYARRLGLPKFNDLWGLCLVHATDEAIEWLLLSGAGLYSEGYITRAMYTGMQMSENGRVKYRILQHCAKTELGVRSEEMTWTQLEAKNYEYLAVRFFSYFWNFVCAMDEGTPMYTAYIKQIQMILE